MAGVATDLEAIEDISDSTSEEMLEGAASLLASDSTSDDLLLDDEKDTPEDLDDLLAVDFTPDEELEDDAFITGTLHEEMVAGVEPLIDEAQGVAIVEPTPLSRYEEELPTPPADDVTLGHQENNDFIQNAPIGQEKREPEGLAEVALASTLEFKEDNTSGISKEADVAPKAHVQPVALDAAEAMPTSTETLQPVGVASQSFDMRLEAIPEEGQTPSVESLADGATFEKMSDDIVKGFSLKDDTFTVTLQPKDLGRVNVSLDRAVEGVVRAALECNNKEAFELLQKDLGTLQQAVQEVVGDDTLEMTFSFKENSAHSDQQNQDGSLHKGPFVEERQQEEQKASSSALVYKRAAYATPSYLNTVNIRV